MNGETYTFCHKPQCSVWKCGKNKHLTSEHKTLEELKASDPPSIGGGMMARTNDASSSSGKLQLISGLFLGEAPQSHNTTDKSEEDGELYETEEEVESKVTSKMGRDESRTSDPDEFHDCSEFEGMNPVPSVTNMYDARDLLNVDDEDDLKGYAGSMVTHHFD